MKTKFTLIILLAGFLYTQAQTWTWSEDYLPYSRTGLSATVLDDSIFYSGGQSDDFYNYSSGIDIYDVGEDEWYTDVLQTPGRWQTNAVSANGMVFIAGGNDFNPNGAWNTYSEIDVFSKESGEWTVEYLSIARNNIGAVAAGNKVFFAGGLNLIGSNFVFYDVIDIYDTETNTWSTEELSVPRALVGTAALGNKVFFAGGLTNLNPVEVSDVVDIYDTETGLWDEISLSEARASIAAISYGNKVYFAGGARSNNTSCTVIDIYNVANSSWEDPIYLSSSRIVTALNIYNALIFTGHVDYINLAYLTWENENGIVEVFYPETGIWELSVPNLIPKRTFYAHIAYENRAYYAGGRPNASSPTNKISILEYTPCLPNGITFISQEEIDNFQTNYPNCTEIEGYVEISGDDITNLNGLEVLTAIGDSLTIWDNDLLISLTGLDNLSSIGGAFEISDNNALISLTGLENLSFIGGNLVIAGNDSLASLNGIENLTSIEGNLNIGVISFTGWPFPGYHFHGNPSLTSLTALSNITSIGKGLSIVANTMLTSLDGLGNVTSIGGAFEIVRNNALTSLTFMENVNSIEGDLFITENESLSSLTGLENLTSIEGDLRIGWNGKWASGGNPSLTSLSSLQNVTDIGGSLEVHLNDALTSLTGLENVTSLGGDLVISDNTSLTSLLGLEGITSIAQNFNIGGNDLTTLSGLDNVTYIVGEFLIVGNGALTSLTGLESLTSTGGDLRFLDNDVLTSLIALNNVTSIGGFLEIESNEALLSILGLDNIDAGSIDSLFISNNISLSTCEVQSICDYLATPNGTIEIYNNATGCNSQAQVQDSCDSNPFSIWDVSYEETFTISPNPCSSAANLQFATSDIGYIILDLFEISGVRIKGLLNEVKMPGTYEIEIDLKGIPAGIYFCVLKTNKGIQTKKIIKL